MNITPEKLRLIADIEEKNLPFEVMNKTGPADSWWEPNAMRATSFLDSAFLVRVKVDPEPVMIPLGPEDVPPGSVLKGNDQWCAILGVSKGTVAIPVSDGTRYLTFQELMDRPGWLIKRPGEDWQPCSKPAP